MGNLRRFWVISRFHFLPRLSTSRFAVGLTQLLSPRGKEEEGGLRAQAAAASPGDLLGLCISALLLGALGRSLWGQLGWSSRRPQGMDVHSLLHQGVPGCPRTQRLELTSPTCLGTYPASHLTFHFSISFWLALTCKRNLHQPQAQGLRRHFLSLPQDCHLAQQEFYLLGMG